MTSANQSDPAVWTFRNIKGGSYNAGDFAGKVVLVVNTASHCGFTPQYSALQHLQDTYGASGLEVLAVPSDDFKQEEPDDAAVQDFCERNFGLTLKMTGMAQVTGPQAHPLYQWLAKEGFVPDWNFAKVLFDRHGRVAAHWTGDIEPLDSSVEAEIKRNLAAG